MFESIFRKQLYVIIMVLVFGYACTDLHAVVYDQNTEAHFNPTGDDIGALMAPAYTPLRGMNLGWYSFMDLQGEASDELVTPVRPNGWYDGWIYTRMHTPQYDMFSGMHKSL